MGDDALMTDKAGDSEPSIPSWMGTVVVAIAVSVSAGLVDGGFTRWRMDIAIGETAWLAVVTATLSAFFALVLAFVGLAIGQTRPIRWLWQRVTERPLAQVGIALFSFVVALVLHWVNATYYVRLYLSIHLAISLVCFCLGILAFGLLLALPRARSNLANLTKRNPKRIVTIGGLVWLLLLAMTISGIRSTHRLRSIALDRSTTLSHQLIVLDSFTGILSREAPSAIDVPTALAKALAPEPLLAPRGLAPRSHVVLITVDSLRADRLTATGAQMATLPVLEALSTESVLFTRARALSCWTISSMTATLTSRVPSALTFTPVSVHAGLKFVRHQSAGLVQNPMSKKVTAVPIDDTRPNIADVLSAVGYQTATVVPYVFYLPEAGVTRGFETIDDDAYRRLPIDGSGITAVPMVDRVIKILDDRTTNDEQRPLFLWLHFMEPHAPYTARDEQARGRGARARYDSELRFVDAEVGRLLTELRNRGLYDNATVVVHADHGEEFGDHGGKFHASTLYQEIIHVPLIVKLPTSVEGTANRQVATPTSALDLLPTVADIVGAKLEQPVSGRSLVPRLLGEDDSTRPVVSECFRFGRQKRSIEIPPYKLIVDDSVGTVELYNLENDPTERHNIADDDSEATTFLSAALSRIVAEAL